MQKIIGVIVHAEDEEEALKKGKDALNEIAKGKRPFDSYRTFDYERDEKDWKGNWSHLPAVTLAGSPEGKAFIEERLQLTEKGYDDAAEKVGQVLSKLSLKQLKNKFSTANLAPDLKKEEIPLVKFTRAYFYNIGDKEGEFFHFLYFEQEPIYYRKDLARKLKTAIKAYVIPAYVHY